MRLARRGSGPVAQQRRLKREWARVSYALSAASPKDLVAHLQAVVNGAGKSAEAALALATPGVALPANGALRSTCARLCWLAVCCAF